MSRSSVALVATKRPPGCGEIIELVSPDVFRLTDAAANAGAPAPTPCGGVGVCAETIAALAKSANAIAARGTANPEPGTLNVIVEFYVRPLSNGAIPIPDTEAWRPVDPEAFDPDREAQPLVQRLSF